MGHIEDMGERYFRWLPGLVSRSRSHRLTYVANLETNRKKGLFTLQNLLVFLDEDALVKHGAIHQLTQFEVTPVLILTVARLAAYRKSPICHHRHHIYTDFPDGHHADPSALRRISSPSTSSPAEDHTSLASSTPGPTTPSHPQTSLAR